MQSLGHVLWIGGPPGSGKTTVVRGYYARPWADGDAETVVREFSCECGDAGRQASVDLPVGDLSAGPVLAPGHG
jgi:hypothetical protein